MLTAAATKALINACLITPPTEKSAIEVLLEPTARVEVAVVAGRIARRLLRDTNVVAARRRSAAHERRRVQRNRGSSSCDRLTGGRRSTRSARRCACRRPTSAEPEPSSQPGDRCVVSMISASPSQRPTEKPIGVAGMSGGALTAVHPNATRRVVLEVDHEVMAARVDDVHVVGRAKDSWQAHRHAAQRVVVPRLRGREDAPSFGRERNGLRLEVVDRDVPFVVVAPRPADVDRALGPRARRSRSTCRRMRRSCRARLARSPARRDHSTVGGLRPREFGASSRRRDPNRPTP